MKKYFITLTILLICGNAFGKLKEPITIEKPVEKTSDYWVYVRLEDRSGVTTEDDAGRSKAGDVVAVLPVSPQHIPSETEKKSYMIYKASLTESKRQEMLEPMVEETGQTDESGQPILKTVAYRKNKLDTSKLGVAVKKGLVAEKIDATKIEYSVKTSDDLARYEVKRKFYAYVQRPAIRLANVITRKAFAETVSTCNKTGEDYNTLTLWEDDKDGDLVTDTRQETVEVYSDDGVLETNLIIDGSTTNSSYYMKVTSAEEDRHEGVYDETKTVLELDTSLERIITVSDEYTIIEWLQFKRGVFPTSTSERICIYYYSLASSPHYCRNNIFKFNLDSDDTGTAIISGVRIYDSSTTVYTINNIFIGAVSTGTNTVNTALYAYNGDPPNNYFYNNTVIDMTYGTYQTSPIIKNSIFQDCGTDSSSPDSSSDYNLTDIVEASSGFNGVGSNNVFNSTLTFNNSSNDDYHLVSGDTDAINAGTSLSGTFTDDIDGDTRSGTWDIGADEYVASRNRLMIIQ